MTRTSEIGLHERQGPSNTMVARSRVSEIGLQKVQALSEIAGW